MGGGQTDIEKILKCYSRRYKLKLTNFSGHGEEYSYELGLDDRKAGDLLKKINALSGVIGTNMVSFSGEAL